MLGVDYLSIWVVVEVYKDVPESSNREQICEGLELNRVVSCLTFLKGALFQWRLHWCLFSKIKAVPGNRFSFFSDLVVHLDLMVIHLDFLRFLFL